MDDFQSVSSIGKIVKMEVDYSHAVDEILPVCDDLAKKGELFKAIDKLMNLEKQTRTGADTFSTTRIVVKIVELCYMCNDLDALNENIVLLTKKRSPIKHAITKMIQECCTYVDKIQNKEQKMRLIETLRKVTEGKIYVEVERARLTLKLASIRENEGNLDDAALILLELQIETIGSLDRREKVEFILEQMRLCIKKKDYIRTQILSKKVSKKTFDPVEMQEPRLKYYKMMIEVDKKESNHLETARHYDALYRTEAIEMKMKLEMLQHKIVYLLLAPYNNEHHDLLLRTKGDIVTDEIPYYRELMKCFLTMELIDWNWLKKSYENMLRGPKTDLSIFTLDIEGAKRWEDFHNRVIEHNIRVMSIYYSRINMSRMTELLELDLLTTENTLSKLVSDKVVDAKIDRLAGIVFFYQHKHPTEILNTWSTNIDKLMKLVNEATHLINKEEMVHTYLRPIT